MKMRKKGAIPIPYIVAGMLGLAVVAVLGYWFFELGGEWGGEASLQDCKSRALAYCTEWQFKGYRYDSDTCEPNVGWFDERYKSCASYAYSLGFTSRGCDESSSYYAEACKAIFSGGGGAGGGGGGDPWPENSWV